MTDPQSPTQDANTVQEAAQTAPPPADHPYDADTQHVAPDTSADHGNETGTLDDSGYPAEAVAEIRKGRNEAKKLRARLREAEAAAEEASAGLEAMRRTEIQRLAADHLIDGTDIWTSVRAVAELLADDGTIDPDKVAQAATAIIAAKPHLAAEQKITGPPTNRSIANLRGGASFGTNPPQPTWANAIRIG